jgi:hypothetical protein
MGVQKLSYQNAVSKLSYFFFLLFIGLAESKDLHTYSHLSIIAKHFFYILPVPSYFSCALVCRPVPVLQDINFHIMNSFKISKLSTYRTYLMGKMHPENVFGKNLFLL